MIIDRNTFICTSTNTAGNQSGTVEATLNGETRRLPAIWLADCNNLIVRGFIGRYRTSAKNWPASIVCQPCPNGSFREVVCFGRDDRSTKFNKANAISFA